MSKASDTILRTYVTLSFLYTFAASFIWGVNTLFLLDAGLSITQAFAANAFYTIGQVVFEVPTGVVADTVGRRASFLLGAATLFASTLLYLLLWQQHAAFWLWAIASVLLGLGFTFFSGATEAWLVDGLNATKYGGTLESAFAKGQVANGIAMLSGTLLGGLVAQITNLGGPYIVRSIVLLLTFVVAFALMKDVGFTPRKRVSVTKEVRGILSAALHHGLGNPPVRLIMLSAPFAMGVAYYGFYAIQPYLLELYGNSSAYLIAGLAAAIIAGTEIAGGLLVPYFGKLFKKRTTLLLMASLFSAGAIGGIGLVHNFWLVLVFLALWGILFSISFPVRQSYINGLIPSEQRATVLSSDNLLTSGGAAIVQPGLGRTADMWGYANSYSTGAAIHLLALPFILLAKRKKAKTDPIQ